MKSSIKKYKCLCGCGESFIRYSLSHKWVNLDHKKHWLLNTIEGQKEVNRVAKKAAKDREKAEKKKDKEAKEKTIKWDKLLQRKVQEIARFIDHLLPCTAKNAPAKQYHGGHIFSRGGNSNIKYNLHNIHIQSAQSNHFQKDDYELKMGVVRVYGKDYLEYIESLKNTPTTKHSNMECKELYNKACKISNRLKSENKNLEQPRTIVQRLSLRNQINLELGIYQTVDYSPS